MRPLHGAASPEMAVGELQMMGGMVALLLPVDLSLLEAPSISIVA